VNTNEKRMATINPLKRAAEATVPYEVGTLAVDWWAVTFGTARRGLGGAAVRPVPSSLYQM